VQDGEEGPEARAGGDEPQVLRLGHLREHEEAGDVLRHVNHVAGGERGEARRQRSLRDHVEIELQRLRSGWVDQRIGARDALAAGVQRELHELPRLEAAERRRDPQAAQPVGPALLADNPACEPLAHARCIIFAR